MMIMIMVWVRHAADADGDWGELVEELVDSCGFLCVASQCLTQPQGVFGFCVFVWGGGEEAVVLVGWMVGGPACSEHPRL